MIFKGRDFKLNIQEIIIKKRDKKELSKEEIEFFVQGYTKGTITDYQAAALIMAIYINGMNEQEIVDLTMAMANSGDRIDLSKLETAIVDKHSTGGVGDKITLIVSPLLASLGVPIAKMSGKGLGYTGGTIDKLQSIPGYRVEIEEEEFIQNIQKIGISLISQTKSIAPADKKIYALRDAISCTDHIALIASSIMSKKIASGADKIVLDVTVGSGAFMKEKESAEKLANIMIQIGKLAGKETVCILTNMNQPLGYAVGNSLEVIEAIQCLKGDLPNDVKEVVLEIGSYMLKFAGKGNNINENKEKIKKAIEDGSGFKKLKELVKNQGGDISCLEDMNKFKKAEYILPVISEKTGVVTKLDAEKIGTISCKLGAGREKKEDKIDESVRDCFK